MLSSKQPQITRAILAASAVVLSFGVNGWAQGCAMCRAALENSPEGKTIAAGLAHGILMMLILPYGLLATFGFLIFRAYRKKSKERQQDSYTYQSESSR
jgi:hypothetical protein